MCLIVQHVIRIALVYDTWYTLPGAHLLFNIFFPGRFFAEVSTGFSLKQP